jgi:hypothetical protein
MKNCITCNILKSFLEFYHDAKSNDGFQSSCKKCICIQKKLYYQHNAEKIKKNRRLYKIQNKELIKQRERNDRKNNPWKYTLYYIKKRCSITTNHAYKDYGGRGIKCFITQEELKHLWFRDKAYNMKKPSIDRINNDSNYCLENCRYIELSENTIKRNHEYFNKKKVKFINETIT